MEQYTYVANLAVNSSIKGAEVIGASSVNNVITCDLQAREAVHTSLTLQARASARNKPTENRVRPSLLLMNLVKK